jgi:tetratricopeptide (TPR) repeat protein
MDESTVTLGLKKLKISKKLLGMILVIVLMILVICLAVIWINRTRSQFYSAKSTQLIYSKSANISTVPQSIFLLKKAFDIYPNDLYARGINNLAIVQINYDISSSPENQNLEALRNGQAVVMSSSTLSYLEVAASSAKESIDINRNDFRNFLQFGSTMQTVALLNLEKNAGGYALQSFEEAVKLAPKHPLPLYSLANLYALAGDKESAKTVLMQALKLKPNFNEANDLYQGILTEESRSVLEGNTNSSSSSSTIKSATSTPASKVKAPTKAILKTTSKTPVKAPTQPTVMVKKATTTSTTTKPALKVIKAPIIKTTK